MRKHRISLPSTVLLVILIFFMMIPFLVLLIGAFKPNLSLISIPIDLNPFGDLTFKNFELVFKRSDIWLWMQNSFILSVSVAALTAAISLTAGYAFARFRFPGRKLLFLTVMATMLMPKQILLIPNYLVAYNLGLQNTMIGLILTSTAPAYGVFLARQYLVTMPQTLYEAAEIDGCGELAKFFRITLPLSFPAVGSVAIFAFFNTFNDYLWQLIMISDKKLKTLPIGIAMFSGAQNTNKGAQLAVGLISTVPLVIMFILFQRFFIKGATDGAVKG